VKHAVEICKIYRRHFAVFIAIENIALTVDVIVNPVLEVLEISPVSGSPPDQIVSIKIERL
jgi:hypothetical protein